MSFGLKKALSIFLCFFVAQSASASIPDGLNWLTDQANPDGSYAIDTDISTAYQATAETLRSFQATGNTSDPGIPAALTYLDANTFHSTEYLSRNIIAGSEVGNSVTALTVELLTHQNPDGGFGELPGYDSTTLDTAYALEALAKAGNASNQPASSALNFLTTQQNTDGSWSLKNNDPAIPVTALASMALQQYRYIYALNNNIDRASNYLIAQMEGSGAIGELYESALSLLALAPALADQTSYQPLIDYLTSAQLADGSWVGDLYTTALATRAWHTQQTAIPPQPQLATLAGQARDVAADQPLSGVTISVTLGADTFTAMTDSQGRYLINDLTPGTASLSASLLNYHGVSATGILSAGQVLTFSPNMAPQPLPQPITISGQVIDGDTSAAISGATIRVLNSSYVTQSGVNGEFSLTGIAAGTATVEIAQTGYITATYSISSPAGGALNLGVISLAPGVANGTTGTVVGLMTDAITGSALRGVQVTVSGADNRTAYTDTEGRFTLTDINPGNIFLTASLTGYRNATGSAELAAGTTLQFNGALVKEENAALVTLFGSVIDGSTQQPLTGVAVNIGSSHTTQTGPQGEFYVSGVEPGMIDVVYMLTGYNPVVLHINATGGSVVDLTGIVLVSDSPVSGNQAPVIASTGPTNAAVGQVYEYRVSVTDPDGDALSFGLSAYPAGMEIDASTGVIRWIPTINQSGQQLFTLVVSDTGGAIAVENVTVSVTQGVDQTYVITDVETLNGLTQDALIPSNYILGSYVTGGRSGTWTASSPLGCGFSYTTTGSDPASIQQAADALDFWSMGSGYGSDAIWDMGMGFSSVSVLPLIDHEPFPQEGIEYTIWGSNDPNATFPDGWELATLVTIYSQGWADNRAQCTESVNIDDYAGLYTFGETEYQYIRLKADNSISIFDTPEHTTWSTNIDDSGLPGWQSVESEIDGVAGMVCDVKPLANAGEDMLGMTGEIIQFDASASQGTILSYGWDLDGDREIDLTGATPSHIFNAGFDQDVSLLVVDDQGCVGSDIVHVTVGLEYPRPDLIVSEIDTADIATNLQTLSIAGSVSIDIANRGRAAAVDAAVVTLYEDSNANGVFDSGIDNQLGTQTMPRGLARNESLSVEMAVNGTVSFRDAPIHAMVDSDSRIDESNETNNTNTSANQCRVIPDSTTFEPVLKWSWSGSSNQPSYNQVMMAPVVVPLEDTNSDGLFDENG